MELVQAVFMKTDSSLPYCTHVWQVCVRQLLGIDTMISSLNKKQLSEAEFILRS